MVHSEGVDTGIRRQGGLYSISRMAVILELSQGC